MSKKVLLSGLKPTGRPHIGNYFGAIKQWVELSNSYESYVFIADYHALNFIQNKKEMQENIIGVLLDYLAIGLDPEKVTLYKQSDISEHGELTWIFDTLITVPYLELSHSYKDSLSKMVKTLSENPEFFKYAMTGRSYEEGAEIIDQQVKASVSVGTFNYPVLMAADILLYEPNIVPVGQDQKQHIEIARDIGEKFNRIYGETFKIPEPVIMDSVAVVPGTDGRKMSKSYGNTIPLFAEYEEIKKCVMSITAGPGMTRDEAIELSKMKGEAVIRDAIGPVRNLLNIHKLVRNQNELIDFYIENQENYKKIKEVLIEDLEKFIAPLRERRKEWEGKLPEALAILKSGGEKAKAIASKKMAEVKEKIGVNVY